MTVLVAGAAVMTLAGVGIATVLREPSGGSVAGHDDALAAPTTVAPGLDRPVATAPASAPTGEETAVPAGFDNAIAATDEPDGCRLTVRSMGIGKSGADVECLQKALADAGFYTASINGLYDNATAEAVRHLQEERGLFVDGVAGRETGLSLGIWPDEESLVVRTPPPPEGAEDRWGFELSPVAVSGDDPNLPPLPADSGSGRRVVYDRAGQRVVGGRRETTR